jgi:hypothetical protein
MTDIASEIHAAVQRRPSEGLAAGRNRLIAYLIQNRDKVNAAQSANPRLKAAIDLAIKGKPNFASHLADPAIGVVADTVKAPYAIGSALAADQRDSKDPNYHGPKMAHTLALLRAIPAGIGHDLAHPLANPVRTIADLSVFRAGALTRAAQVGEAARAVRAAEAVPGAAGKVNTPLELYYGRHAHPEVAIPVYAANRVRGAGADLALARGVAAGTGFKAKALLRNKPKYVAVRSEEVGRAEHPYHGNPIARRIFGLVGE